jgi:hypothetical protein
MLKISNIKLSCSSCWSLLVVESALSEAKIVSLLNLFMSPRSSLIWCITLLHSYTASALDWAFVPKRKSIRNHIRLCPWAEANRRKIILNLHLLNSEMTSAFIWKLRSPESSLGRSRRDRRLWSSTHSSRCLPAAQRQRQSSWTRWR